MDAFNLNELEGRGLAGNDFDGSDGKVRKSGQKFDDGQVGFAIHRRCCHVQFPAVAVLTGELRFGRTGADFK